MDRRRINLALQGGGAHGAFTWGVLDRLLDEDWLDIAAISGTSGRSSSATSVRAIRLAVAVDPVNATPAIRGSAVSACPTSGPPGVQNEQVSGTEVRMKCVCVGLASSGTMKPWMRCVVLSMPFWASLNTGRMPS